jgi:Peptidase inhibitor I9
LLEDVGFKVENRVPEINFVSGKITANSFEKLLEVAGVKKVEPDSKVYALGQ